MTEPKRPKTAYQHFLLEISSNPLLCEQSLSKKREIWNNLSAKERQRYLNACKDDKLRYVTEMKRFKLQQSIKNLINKTH